MSDVVTSFRGAGANQWWVQVRGKAYGPYTMQQLAAFSAEGRVRPASLVSTSPDGGWIEARRVLGLMAPAGAGAPANDAVEAANVFVHAEIVTGSWTAFVAALESLGQICDLAPGLWLLRTRYTSGVVRNTLSQTLERGDRFVAIDATRDRFAWFNLGPEVDARINTVWNAPLR